MVRVLHINTADRIGGAAIAAYRLHKGLRDFCGVESQILAGIKVSDDSNVLPVYEARASYIVNRIAHRILRHVGLTGITCLPHSPTQKKLIENADIIHLHHIHSGFFSYPALLSLAKTRPVIWTLHDMWSFTGGCPYAYDCTHWRDSCGECVKTPTHDSVVRFPRWHLEKKRILYCNRRLTIVCPSRWLARLAKESRLHSHLDVRYIPNGVEIDIFRPMDKTIIRAKWGIPANAPLVFAQAHARKGAGRLRTIMSGLPDALRRQLRILLVGHEPPAELTALLGPERVRMAGHISEPGRMAECYAMADLFLLPTAADNLPNTLLEAASCGTPAVTFDVGGCPEVVRHLETGYVAEAGNDEDFTRGIAFLFENANRRLLMGREARSLAMKEYDIRETANRYRDLYHSLLGNDLSAHACEA